MWSQPYNKIVISGNPAYYFFFQSFSASQVDSPWIPRTTTKYGSDGESEENHIVIKFCCCRDFSVGVFELKKTPITD